MKKLFSIILVLLMLSLAACGGGGTEPAKTEVPEATAEAARDPYEDYNNHYMCFNRVAKGWADTKDYLFFDCRYYDKNTGDCGFYCAKPDCLHNDDTCEAYKTVLGIYDGKLYVTGWADNQHVGIYTQNFDGSERKLVRILADDEVGNRGVHLHRGKLYMFFKKANVDDGVPSTRLRLTMLDPLSEETRVLHDRVYVGGVSSSVFFHENTAYLLVDRHITEDDEYSDGRVWELWTYDITSDVMELSLQDNLTEGFLRNCWITAEGEIYFMLEKDIEAEREEDWQWSYTLAKIEDGSLKELWDVPYEPTLGDAQVYDGIVVSQYSTNFLYNKDVRFRVQDLDGSVIADGFLPYPDLGEDAEDYTFERYEIVWGDKTCMWMMLWFTKPVIHDGSPTTTQVMLTVKYDISDGGFVISFVEPTDRLPLIN